MKLKPSHDAMQNMFERQSETLDAMVADFRSGRHDALPWRVVSANRLTRLWTDAATEGFLRNERSLDQIERVIVDNVLKLSVTTEISGHAATYPEEALQDHFDDPDERERFIAWAVEIPEGGFRVSDYGMDRLFELAALATETQEPMERLAVLDMILNVTHPRSDIASWFVEGGSMTLSKLSEAERPGLRQLNTEESGSCCLF